MPGQQPSDIQGSDPYGRPLRRTNDRDEVDQLKAEVHCATVLERLPPTWRLDRGESTRRALKYRRGQGEIIIVNHDGRGWWDPGHATAKGDVFNLVQHLDPGLSFGQVRHLLRTLAGMVPSFPEHLRAKPRRHPAMPIGDLVAPPPAARRRQRHLALPHASARPAAADPAPRRLAQPDP